MTGLALMKDILEIAVLRGQEMIREKKLNATTTTIEWHGWNSIPKIERHTGKSIALPTVSCKT